LPQEGKRQGRWRRVVLAVEIDAGALAPEELDTGSREGMEKAGTKP